MIKTTGVVHFTIPVTDMQKAKNFYCDLLGFEVVGQNDHMIFCKSQDDHFVLTHSEQPVDPNKGDRHEIHHAFYVDPDEYDRSLKYLEGKGVKVFKEEQREKGVFTGRSAYFHDPDRNVIELLDSNK
jgi:catechol 2,3-dioxygenase-like lactoylglutathione lyase family enzyme